MKIKLLTCILAFIILMANFSCKKTKVANWQTLINLYSIYKNGQIEECKYKGVTVYGASYYEADAGYTIYDKDGNVMSECTYASQPDSICGHIQDCEIIYRNGYGLSFIDKYGLSK